MNNGTQLPKRIKRVWRLSAILVTIVLLLLAAAGFVGTHLFNWPLLFWTSIGFVGIAIVYLIVELAIIPYRYAFWRYTLTADAVELQSGYIFKKLVSIPIARVQDVTLSAGPLLQSQKLQEVAVTTAATTHKIDGLEPDVANQLRHQIMQLALEVKDQDV